MRRLSILIAALALVPLVALAQVPPATLVADRVTLDAGGRLIAEGEVVVFYEGTELRASRVIYDPRDERLAIEGPIRITDPDGSFLLADAAELDGRLREGLLTSARLVLDQQLQLAAAEIARVGDRYTRLERVVASSCQICPDRPTPLWEIRAARVVHDEDARQLYFTNAQFRLFGVPVLYLPRLRLPDPGNERASGLLLPDLVFSSDLGTGVKLPYFLVLSPYSDLTFAPYLSSRTRTLEYRYRHNFARGGLAARGAFSSDELDGRRAYLFADAEFALPRGFELEADLRLVSDPGYLFTYDYAEADRLANEVRLLRVRDKDLFRASATEYRSLREEDRGLSDTLPDRYGEVTYIRVVPELAFGGRTEIRLDAAALNRPSDADVAGRDVSRVGAGIDWRAHAIFGPGIVAAAEAGLRADLYNIGQDSRFATNVARIVPRAAAELRWPLRRVGRDGAVEVVEPVLRLDWADTGPDRVPLEDSRVVEFDEANLVSPSRYPGIDGIEDGARAVAAVYWRRNGAGGWQSDVAMGRVLAFDGDLDFDEGTGLQGDRSEWVVGGRIEWRESFALMQRSLFEDDFDFTLNETRLEWRLPRARLSAAYIAADPEPAEGRLTPLAELTAAGAWDFAANWTATAGVRYDFDAGRAARADLGIGYRNECAELGLSLSRRYATSTSVDPTTEFSLSFELRGFGNETGGARLARGCRG